MNKGGRVLTSLRRYAIISMLGVTPRINKQAKGL